MRKYKKLVEGAVGSYHHIRHEHLIRMESVEVPRLVADSVYSWMEPRTRNHRMVARLYRRKFCLYNGVFSRRVELAYSRVASKARFRYKHVYL